MINYSRVLTWLIHWRASKNGNQDRSWKWMSSYSQVALNSPVNRFRLSIDVSGNRNLKFSRLPRSFVSFYFYFPPFFVLDSWRSSSFCLQLIICCLEARNDAWAGFPLVDDRFQIGLWAMAFQQLCASMNEPINRQTVSTKKKIMILYIGFYIGSVILWKIVSSFIVLLHCTLWLFFN